MREEREKVLRDLLKLPIDPNSNASDVIEAGEGRFKNLRTGKEAERVNEAVDPGQPAVVIPADSLRNGYLALYYKQHKAVVFLLCCFQVCSQGRRWVETERCAIGLGGDEFMATDGFIHELNLSSTKESIDIQGSCCEYDSDSLLSASAGSIINIPLASARAMRQFTKGGAWRESRSGKILFDTFSDIKDFINLKDDCADFKYGIQELYMENIHFEKKPLPEELKKRLRENYCKGYFSMEVVTHVGYLQESFGDLVYRDFVVTPKGLIEKDGSVPLKYIEERRYGITGGNMEDIPIYSWPLGLDKEGIAKSRYGYALPRIEKLVEKQWEKFSTTKAVYANTIKAELLFLTNPGIEKAVNFVKQHYKKDTDDFENLDSNTAYGYLMKEILSVSLPEKLWFDMIIDTDPDGKDITQVFKAPKAFLTEVIEDGRWQVLIRFAQFAFQNNMEYFMSMNAEDCKKLANIAKDPDMRFLTDRLEFAENLVKVAGPSNFFSAVDFAKEIKKEREDEFETFRFYIEMLSEVREYVKKVDWRLKGEALEKSAETIAPVYNILMDKEAYKEYLDSFRARYKELERYEFDKGDFCVIYPKGPSDLVQEGLALHHCVKDFISNVANRSTIILFIRKKERPLKPFFTMEIYMDEIRQVHGVKNCNVSEYKGLLEFVKAFAKEKELDYDYDDANELMGPAD